MFKVKIETFRGVMERYAGQGPGFDFLRIALALSIVYAHSFLVTDSKAGLLNAVLSGFGGSADALEVHKRPINLIFIPMFFAISGFLVTGSAFRTTVVSKFITFRVLRIVPALLTEVTLSAIFLGPLFTNDTLRNYFSDTRFFAYFGNIIGRVRFVLPGVFSSNPFPSVVNVNLWTLQPEFYCYVASAVLMGTSLLFDRKLFTIIFGVTTIGLIGINLIAGFGEPSGNYPATVVVYYFFCGSLIYHWRHVIPSTVILCVVAWLVAVIAMHFNGTVFVIPLLFSYVIIYLGMINFPRIPILQSGDYSYGVYLYGFPIQQAIVGAFPQFSGHGWWMVAVSSLSSIAFAMASWHFIERPALSLKTFVGLHTRSTVADKQAAYRTINRPGATSGASRPTRPTLKVKP